MARSGPREAWRGHVGFFVSRVNDGIYVLGGNQMPARAKLTDGTYETRNTGEINVSRMRVAGADLNLHSFHTDRASTTCNAGQVAISGPRG
jgi:hypothetical protein